MTTDHIQVRTLDDYQKSALITAKYPRKNTLSGLTYCALKMNGEAGEFAEHLGKAMRDDGLLDTEKFTTARRELLIKELGDVLWYIAAAANELDTSLSVIAQINLEKLQDRIDRGVVSGSGDNR